MVSLNPGKCASAQHNHEVTSRSGRSMVTNKRMLVSVEDLRSHWAHHDKRNGHCRGRTHECKSGDVEGKVCTHIQLRLHKTHSDSPSQQELYLPSLNFSAKQAGMATATHCMWPDLPSST